MLSFPSRSYKCQSNRAPECNFLLDLLGKVEKKIEREFFARSGYHLKSHTSPVVGLYAGKCLLLCFIHISSEKEVLPLPPPPGDW